MVFLHAVSLCRPATQQNSALLFTEKESHTYHQIFTFNFSLKKKNTWPSLWPLLIVGAPGVALWEECGVQRWAQSPGFKSQLYHSYQCDLNFISLIYKRKGRK